MSQHHNAFDTPLDVEAVQGEVAITGPGGLNASLTREAAIASAKRLLEAAGKTSDEETYQKPLG